MNLINSKSSKDDPSSKLITTNPLSKKSTYKIKEIDFTHSVTATTPLSDILKCPVIECDFNFMAERSKSPSKFPKAEENDNLNSQCRFHRETDHEWQMKNHDEVSENGLFLLKKLQSIWNSTVCLLRGNEKLNYDQMIFLIDFYFNSKTNEGDSSRLLSFYKSEIQSIIKKDGVKATLNFVDHAANNDEERSFRLTLKGIYLCMLALIIEESLDILRLNANIGRTDAVCNKFSSLFSTEIVYLGLGYKGNNILFIVQEYLSNTSNGSRSNERVTNSLVFVSCCIAFLNREVTGYKKQGAISDSRLGFHAIFTTIVNVISNNGSFLKIWMNPEEVILIKNESKQRTKEFRIHLCYAWLDLVRLLNLITFNIIPFIKHPEKLDSFLGKLYRKVEEAEARGYHISFIKKLKSSQHDELMTVLNINYLIARVYNNLKYGVTNIGAPNLTTDLLAKMVSECKSWIHYETLNNLKRSRMFESRCLLHYLSFHITYIIVLQNEELLNENTLNELYPELLSEFCDFLSYLQMSIKEESKCIGGQYILITTVEILTRLVQFMVGLLLRFGTTTYFKPTSPLLGKIISIVSSKFLIDDKLLQEGEGLSQTLKKLIVSIINDTIELLSTSYIFDKEKVLKLSKLWNFYLTFIKNSHKISSFDYAKIHADIPGFRTINEENDAQCPVISDSNIVDANIPVKTEQVMHKNNSGLDKCPISHITTPMDYSESAPAKLGKCPIDHTTLGKPQSSKKRKAALQEDRSLNSIASSGYNPIESNLRDSNTNHKRHHHAAESQDGIQSSIEMISTVLGLDSVTNNNSIIDSVSNSLTSTEPDLFPSEIAKSDFSNIEFPNFDINWQEFTDFGFDFLQNEVLANKIQGNEPDNSSIEGLFR